MSKGNEVDLFEKHMAQLDQMHLKPKGGRRHSHSHHHGAHGAIAVMAVMKKGQRRASHGGYGGGHGHGAEAATFANHKSVHGHKKELGLIPTTQPKHGAKQHSPQNKLPPVVGAKGDKKKPGNGLVSEGSWGRFMNKHVKKPAKVLPTVTSPYDIHDAHGAKRAAAMDGDDYHHPDYKKAEEGKQGRRNPFLKGASTGYFVSGDSQQSQEAEAWKQIACCAFWSAGVLAVMGWFAYDLMKDVEVGDSSFFILICIGLSVLGCCYSFCTFGGERSSCKRGERKRRRRRACEQSSVRAKQRASAKGGGGVQEGGVQEGGMHRSQLFFCVRLSAR
jgi:hypothetical protein